MEHVKGLDNPYYRAVMKESLISMATMVVFGDEEEADFHKSRFQSMYEHALNESSDLYGNDVRFVRADFFHWIAVATTGIVSSEILGELLGIPELPCVRRV